jgi:eukaryotic-like serine/threonine-protein kinase
MTAKVLLEATAGPLAGRRFVFHEHDTLVFGRSRDCHAHLSKDDKFSSRHHFLLEVNPPQARIRDLGSLNGTYVNGVKYGGRHAGETPKEAISRAQSEVNLKDQDEIQIGDSVFRIFVTSTTKGNELVSCQTCGTDITQEMTTLSEGRFCQSCAATLVTEPFAADSLLTEVTQLKQTFRDEIAAYEILDLLGRGGMGTVHRARRLADGKMVALKTMIAKVAVGDRARDLFLREIEITKQLAHPNLVQLLDFSARGNSFFFVMDLCPKGSVQDLLKEKGRPLFPQEAVPVVLDALEGIAFAHQRSIVHRDIKPENILLKTDGERLRALIADFGLAKNFELAGLSGLTATGTSAGTPRFMPREQLLHYRYVNPLSDLWSLAATLYFMLTAKLPRDFPKHRDPIEVILHGGSIPLKDRDPQLPDDLCRIIDRTLSDQPDHRPQSAEEFSVQLRSVINS